MNDQNAKTIFMKPVLDSYVNLKSKRNNKAISDLDFIEMGIRRVMEHYASGRDFIQSMIDEFNFEKLSTDNFFKALKSPRRLKLMQELNKAIIENYQMLKHNDPFATIPELNEFKIYAGDGHFHSHASHERHENGKAYPVGHIYSMNLRTGLMMHLDVLRPEDKMENEIHALQRLGGPALRMGEPTGTKVILVYDRACVDFKVWYIWKQGSGVYVVTRNKKNMNLTPLGDLKFDKDNPINAGIVSDQQVSHSHGRLIREIVYIDPITNNKFSFITNIMTLPPGIIAYLYLKRWNIEKGFQKFKCIYKEQKAWATSNTAKLIQANSLCLAHNLTVIMGTLLEDKEKVVDQKIIDKQEKRFAKIKEILKKKNRKINPLLLKVFKSTMMSCQFIRLIVIIFKKNTCWNEFIRKLRPRMEEYL
jgi:hypothetical protein